MSFQDGEYVETVPPGEYAFWHKVAASKLVDVDLREQTIDIAGQEIMTADKVTLRMSPRHSPDDMKDLMNKVTGVQ